MDARYFYSDAFDPTVPFKDTEMAADWLWAVIGETWHEAETGIWEQSEVSLIDPNDLLQKAKDLVGAVNTYNTAAKAGNLTGDDERNLGAARGALQTLIDNAALIASQYKAADELIAYANTEREEYYELN